MRINSFSHITKKDLYLKDHQQDQPKDLNTQSILCKIH